MKIGFTGMDLPEGKVKYRDSNLEALVEKDKPKKVSPYFAEFLKDEFHRCDAIVVRPDRLLDVLIHDLDAVDVRLSRATDDAEREVLARCVRELENETPLSEVAFSEAERALLRKLTLCSLNPVARIENGADVNDIIATAMDAAGLMFFYTSGPSESHAWLVEKGASIVDCAGRIHTDLARGFIKGDVAAFDDYMAGHNFNDCRARGLARLVDRDYVVQSGDVIEIRFKS